MGGTSFARARIGTVLSGKWRLDELLGTGGMACVYAGTHTRNRSRVAVKVLHPEVGQEPVLKARFLREGYVANSIKHPGIVRVFDDSADDDCAYLVMDLLIGKTLKEAWKKSDRAMPLKEIGRVISAMLDVLAVAHAAGIVHRDIKPDNVFLTDEGEIKVLDFGIAFVQELRGAGEHVTTIGTMLGTPAFMPPEQAHGEWALVDHRADIYSVGATARLLLTGRLPHEAEGATQLLIAAATKRAPPTLSVAPDVPAGIAEVVDRALEFEREERYQSAEDMKRDWDRAVSAAIASGAESVPTAPPAPASWSSGAASESGASAPVAASGGMTGGSAASFTHSAVSKDAASRGRGRGVTFAVIGLVAAVVVVIGVFAMGGAGPETASAPSTVVEGPVAAATGRETASTTVTVAPASTAAGVSSSSTIASEPRSSATAASSVAGTPPRSAGPVGGTPIPATIAAQPSPNKCPPVLYGRDMNDQPEYRCCGKPCAR